MAIKQLSILFMKDGFSFCVLKDNELIHAQSVVYDDQILSLKEKLNHSFKQNLYLNQTYNEVQLCYLGSQFNLIPLEYFHKDSDAQKWLEFSSEIYEDDIVEATDLNTTETKLVYALPKELQNYVREKYPSSKIVSASKVFIDSITSNNNDIEEVALFVNIHLAQTEVLIYQNSHLQLYNIFETSTKEDIVYFVLNCIQQLGYDANKIKLYYFGWEIDGSMLKMLMNFVRHVMPGTGNKIELQYFTQIQNTK